MDSIAELERGDVSTYNDASLLGVAGADISLRLLDGLEQVGAIQTKFESEKGGETRIRALSSTGEDLLHPRAVSPRGGTKRARAVKR